ncbi:hypothetical protein [Streptomyces uncialis]|nr:hypothetical protein [Streptomyces uncialis]MCX4658615.1 hypothetical protein [Streptomyces uncialis]
MVIATEYATGGIRTTLRWVPIRHRMPLSKSLAANAVGYGVLRTRDA